MIKPIMRDRFFLSLASEPANENDLPVVTDLIDTLRAHQHECVGMAANMIGVRKRIIAVRHDDAHVAMINPEVIEAKGPFETEEGCLSLPGSRPTARYKTIKVSYLDEHMQKRTRTFSGWTAQIIQHEIDHCNGVLI